jgi:hypothetical protein
MYPSVLSSDFFLKHLPPSPDLPSLPFQPMTTEVMCLEVAV